MVKRTCQKEIELERSVIVSELEGGENNPHNQLYKTLKANAYQAHSYRNPIIGWKDDLQNINFEHMKAFYDRYYYPDNSVAILVGSFDKALALELIDKYLPSALLEVDRQSQYRRYLCRRHRHDAPGKYLLMWKNFQSHRLRHLRHRHYGGKPNTTAQGKWWLYLGSQRRSGLPHALGTEWRFTKKRGRTGNRHALS